MKTKSDIRARLTIYGFDEMGKVERKRFNQWIDVFREELIHADPKDYSKIFR